MHDMSNTRKEIAARLGFAAKEVFAADKRTTAGALRKALKAKGITSAADLEWHGISAKDPDSTPYWLYEDGSMEKIKASRPGAKASFGRAEDVYRLLETTPGSYANYKKRDALVTEAMRLADITPAGKDVSLHELAEMVGQDLEADRSRMSRPGAKAAFDNKQIAQGLSRLLKETGFDGMASDVLSGSSDSETLRKYVRVLKGKMSPLSGDAKSAELLSKLEKMLSARAGEKTVMEKSIDELKKAMDKAVLKHSSISSSSYMAQIKARQPNATPADIQQAASLKRKTENAWSEWLHARENYRNAVGLPMQSSRPGTKTRMTREQTEEQKAGLKIMSAADPAVGAKIATLIKEGKPQDQAVAIALDMKRRGEL